MPELQTHASYDEVPYEGVSISATHPGHLATLATLFGMTPAPVGACRVLELACAMGNNLTPMALGLPGSDFVGVDLSETHIQRARVSAAALGARNVRFEQRDILQVDESFGQFDYIIAYGVYSWVPPEVQEKIMHICRERLTPNGVAFISYNTYPGWHMRGAVRDMMRYHSRHFADIHERADQARALLQFLTDASGAMARDDRPALQFYHDVLAAEQEMLNDRPDYYLIHEHLEGVNEPVYLYQFVERAALAGLQYLSDASFSSMLPINLPPEIARTLDKIAVTNIAVEQYKDFILNRTFRQSLLCGEEHHLRRDLQPEALQPFFVRCEGLFVEPGDPKFAEGETKVRTRSGTVIALPSAIAAAIASILIEASPLSIPFLELATRAATAALPGASPAEAMDRVGQIVLRLFALDVIELGVHQPAMAAHAGEKPRASAVALRQAGSRSTLTNLRHENVQLDQISGFLLPFVDGTRTRPQLAEALRGAVASGEIALEADDRVLPADALSYANYAALVESALNTLATMALLEA